MRKVILLMMLGCVACFQQDAQVLSSDGSKVLGYCTGANWASCMVHLCPNGYDVVSDQGGCAADESTMKCKSEDKTNVK